MKFSRRDFINHLKNILGTASVYPFINNQQLFAQNDQEHYFIFVELRGGVHHTVVADFPDPDEISRLKETYPASIMPFSLHPESAGFLDGRIYGKNQQNFPEFLKKGLANDPNVDPHELVLHQAPHRLNGYFCALPMTDKDGKELFHIGENNKKIRLGSAGLDLANHANDISVLRGVYMMGNFHGFANKEIYSGSSTNAGPHVAGVLAKLLVEDKGLDGLPLDNIILNGASYSFGSEAKKIVAPIQLSLESLVGVAGQANNMDLDPAKILATALRDKYQGGYDQKLQNIVGDYINSFADVAKIKEKIRDSVGDYDSKKSSNNIYQHLKTCLSLFASGLTRVATVTVGDLMGFGMFDSHKEMYHRKDNFHKLIRENMESIANFITDLKDHRLADKVTLVVSSEFGRSNNFAGNQEQYREGGGAFGNGHYYFNNNYIFYGKNIAKGQWLGESDPVTRYPYVCNIDELNNGKYSNAFQSPIKIVDVDDNPQHGKKIVLKDGFTGGELQHDNVASSGTEIVKNTKTGNRAIMSKDVVRTIMKIAGLEDRFSDYYPGVEYTDAKSIDKIIS